MTKKQNIILRVWRHIIRLFSARGTESPKERKKREDYEFLVSHGVETEYGNVCLLGTPIIKKYQNSRIVLGKGITLISDSQYNTAGVNHPVILATEAEGAEIHIGDGVGMSGTSVVAVKKVTIGDYTMLGVNTNVHDTDFHCVDAEKRKAQTSIIEANSAPIVIGENVWVGANSTILKGVEIGNDVVVGVHSLVNRSMPNGVLCAGNPAIVKKENLK